MTSQDVAQTRAVSPFVSCFLIYVGTLSSVAEVAHYLCHVPESKIVRVLQKASGWRGILRVVRERESCAIV